jgi:hypothetical protein
MSTKIAAVDDDEEGRRLSAAIHRRFVVNACVEREGKGAGATLLVVTHDAGVGGEQLKRVRRYAEGWLDSLAERR